MSNKKEGTEQATRRRKVVEGKLIDVGLQARAGACGKTSTEKGNICTGKKVYRPPLPSTYKETELLEDPNNIM